MTGFAVEFGWAVGESISVPHLLSPPLSLSPATAGLIYIINPLVSIVAGPVIGNRSDKCVTCARRTPFIIAFAAVAFAGFALLVYSPNIKDTRIQTVLYFMAFGAADFCHDMLLIPGRSLLLDMVQARFGHGGTVDPEQTSHAETLYTVVQALGRLCGLLAIACK